MPAQGRNNVVIPYGEGFCRGGLPSYELLCSNAVSDERGEPRVMRCLAATLWGRFICFGHKEHKRKTAFFYPSVALRAPPSRCACGK